MPSGFSDVKMHTSQNYSPKTKLSGLKIWPKGPDLTESIVPGSRSTNTQRGTYFPPMRGVRHIAIVAQDISKYVLNLTRSFVVIDIYPVQLQVTVTVVCTSWVNAMLITDHLPKLKANQKCAQLVKKGKLLRQRFNIFLWHQYSNSSKDMGPCFPQPWLYLWIIPYSTFYTTLKIPYFQTKWYQMPKTNTV